MSRFPLSHQEKIYPHPLGDQNPDHGLRRWSQTMVSDHGLSLLARFFLLQARTWTSLSFGSQMWGSQGVGVDPVIVTLVNLLENSPSRKGQIRGSFS